MKSLKIDSAIRALEEAGIDYFTNNDGIHIVCEGGKYDLWPTKNHWQRRGTSICGYNGVTGLIEDLLRMAAKLPSVTIQPSIEKIEQIQQLNILLDRIECLDYQVRKLQETTLTLSRLSWRNHG